MVAVEIDLMMLPTVSTFDGADNGQSGNSATVIADSPFDAANDSLRG